MAEAADLLDERNTLGDQLVTLAVVNGDVAVVTLNRPERNNAWNEAMEVQFYAAMDAAVADQRVRAILLTGSGSAFCPGMDTARLSQVVDENKPYMSDRRPQTFLRHVPKPVVAAVNGACAGIGLVQALMADVRFTADDAKWTAAFTRIGLVAEDAIAWRLQRIAGEGVASDLLLSSRIFTGAEAARLGVATRACPLGLLMDTALEYTRELATRSPASLALVKRQLVLDAEDTLEHSRTRSVDYLAQAKLLPDYREGVRAHLEHRKAAFPPLPDGMANIDTE